MSEQSVRKEQFARLFVITVQNKMNLDAFTYFLERSKFVEKIESGGYDEYFNQDLECIFFDVTENRVGIELLSYGVYDDAYWAGSMYFELFQRTHKPFAYLFAKLPLSKMMDMYPVFHEMDYSALEDQFLLLARKKSILRILCDQKGCSIPKLSKATGICASTLGKYAFSDDALYNGSFQTIMKIAKYFGAHASLFLKSVD